MLVSSRVNKDEKAFDINTWTHNLGWTFSKQAEWSVDHTQSINMPYFAVSLYTKCAFI